MAKRIARKRIIFSNYNPEDYYEDAKQNIIDNNFDEYGEDEEEREEPSESEIWDEVNWMMDTDFEDEWDKLTEFFPSGKYILSGSVGRWNGVSTGFDIFNTFEDAYRFATKDCMYVEMYDENGHFYIRCSHHDGTNSFELRMLTCRGVEYYESWDYSWNDKRSHSYIGEKLMSSRYSRTPRYMEKLYGCKRFDWEKES